MTSQIELATQLAALAAQQDKARAEIVAKLAALEEAIVANPVSPDVEAAVAALRASIQATDDIVPDATPA